MPIFGCSPRPRKSPGGSIRKFPIFSLWPSITQIPYSLPISSFCSLIFWNHRKQIIEKKSDDVSKYRRITNVSSRWSDRYQTVQFEAFLRRWWKRLLNYSDSVLIDMKFGTVIVHLSLKGLTIRISGNEPSLMERKSRRFRQTLLCIIKLSNNNRPTDAFQLSKLNISQVINRSCDYFRVKS